MSLFTNPFSKSNIDQGSLFLERDPTTRIPSNVPTIPRRIPMVEINPDAYKTRSDVPYTEGGGSASYRYNNPAAAYPHKRDVPFGLMGYGVLRSKQGTHQIGRFPTPIHGAAANLNTFASRYKGLSVEDAVSRWRGNKGRGENVDIPEGYKGTDVIDDDFISDQRRMTDFFRKMALHESKGTKTPHSLSDDDWEKAYKMFKAGGAKNYRG